MNDNPKPIKRHKALQPLSRQHHFGLLFSWKIRKGFAQKTSIQRMQNFRDWFFKTEILPHFEAEEKHIFPILDKNHPLIARALKEHRRIKRLFVDTENIEKSLSLLEEELQAHIRFEERILFNQIQEIATKKQLKLIDDLHLEVANKPEYHDPFWT